MFLQVKQPKAIFCWSGGKDSAYCLYKVLAENYFDVKYLLTTVNHSFKRVSMHGVREELLDAQAGSIGIPLVKVWVKEGTNQEYEQQMQAVLLQAKSEGIDHVIFGDIFLEDLRVYRENNLAKINMTAVFPLWKMDTGLLIRDFIARQFKSITCCVSDAHLTENWVGKEIDASFVEQLPTTVDPCGENGEFHSFCYEGSIFKTKIPFTIGEKVFRDGFWFCDLLPLSCPDREFAYIPPSRKRIY
jgi:uncharacterized protein (TIGR00290 family)